MNDLHYKITQVASIAGFVQNVIENSQKVQVLSSGFFDSDEKLFHEYTEHLFNEYLSQYIISDHVNSFLVLIHKDRTADVYINNIPVLVKMSPKYDVEVNQLIYKNDIIEITEVRFQGIDILENDSIVYCFKCGWKFGLYFDFRPFTDKGTLNLPQLYKILGSCRNRLFFHDIFSVLKMESSYRKLFDMGWFPFINIVGGEYEKLTKTQDDKHLSSLIKKMLDKFDQKRLNKMQNRWFKKKIYSDKKAIIQAGIYAFLQNTDEGNINSIKTLFSEIEGIIRLLFVDEKKNGRPPIRELIEFIQSKAEEKYPSDGTLTFPSYFIEYLRDVIFKGFDLLDNDIPMSRHTASHGVASSELYTREKALQAILTLDQISYYLI